jgi:hypothetical protein
MSIIKAIVSCGCVLAAVSLSYAKEWHGIVPLHSTRSDVERLLGPPRDPTKEDSSIYNTENEVVFIVYAVGPPCGPDGANMWQVPRGTVVGITLSPKAELRFSDLHIEESNYKITDGGHVPGYTYYTDEKEGVKFEVTRGKVMSITYFHSAKDNHLRCPTPTAKPWCNKSRSLSALFVLTDESGNKLHNLFLLTARQA